MRGDCHLQIPNCPDGYSDAHHIFKEADADTILKRVFCNLGSNAIQLCRCVHRELEAQGLWLPYPEPEVMLDVISSEVAIGHESLSATKKRKLGL